ncbi:MAG: SRPBCC domain-containing protein [Bacteroidota bacterium]
METKKSNELVITRLLNASQELVFKTFTEAGHLAHWWGPKGMKLEVINLDVRNGGKFHYKMISAEGHEMFGVFHYKEVSPFGKIVFTNGFADKDGNLIRAPFATNFPMEVLNTWTFEEEDGKTRLTLKGIPYNATEEENQFFEAMHAGMNQGFGGTFEQWENYLTSI